MATLGIVQERWGDLPIAVDAEGRAQEYTLRYAVIFNLKNADGSVVVPDQSIELGRDYVVPPTDSLGSASEREMLTREMRRDMVATVLRRIADDPGTPQDVQQQVQQWLRLAGQQAEYQNSGNDLPFTGFTLRGALAQAAAESTQ